MLAPQPRLQSPPQDRLLSAVAEAAARDHEDFPRPADSCSVKLLSQSALGGLGAKPVKVD